MSDKPHVSRSEAKAQGSKVFYTGPGKCGHDAPRYVVNGACTDCTAKKAKASKELAKTDKPKAKGADFKWTDDARRRLCDVYVDTGDIESARAAVGVLPSEYHRELARNNEFKDAIVSATALAIQTLEDKAMGHALRGNEKLALAILKASFPDQYSERVKVDNTHTHTVKLSDDELDKRIARLQGRVVATVPKGASRALEFARGESEEGSAE